MITFHAEPPGGAPGPPRHADSLVDGLLDAPLFQGVQREEVVGVLSDFDEESFNTGHRITLQGFRGSDFFIVVDGRARVLIDGEAVATLERGDFFGEVAVIAGLPRTATVVAETPLRCLVLPHRALEELLKQHPQMSVNLLRGVLQRLS